MSERDELPVYRVRTVDGIVDVRAEEGVVLPHEHVLSDSRVWWEGDGDWQEFDDPERIAAVDPSELHSHPQSTLRENLMLSDWYLGAKELRLARDAGTRLVVDLTVLGGGQNVEIAARAARLGGVGLVASAGRYLEPALPPGEVAASEEELVERWTDQVARGFDGGVPGERLVPGIIGEIGTGWDVTDAERTSLRAAARVQAMSGLPINIHVHPFAKRALSAIAIAESAGADPGRIAISHLDCEIDLPQLEAIMRTGAYVEMDNFGTSRRRFVNGDAYPDDSERLDAIDRLLQSGFGSQLLLSHDINHRNSLVHHGGWGYRHIALDIVPRLVERFGDEVARRLTAHNPLSLLHLDPGAESRLAQLGA